LKARQQQQQQQRHAGIRYHKSDPLAAFYMPLCVYTLTFNKLQNVQDCDIKKLFLLGSFFATSSFQHSHIVCKCVCVFIVEEKNKCFVMLLHSSLRDVACSDGFGCSVIFLYSIRSKYKHFRAFPPFDVGLFVAWIVEVSLDANFSIIHCRVHKYGGIRVA
jgi:hypothetical protein